MTLELKQPSDGKIEYETSTTESTGTIFINTMHQQRRFPFRSKMLLLVQIRCVSHPFFIRGMVDTRQAADHFDLHPVFVESS